ncbi:hypothetical protein HGA91_06145 [candidate division WWE3 bacterium]|nr:hypothetical protein [candidate division WWE3 bacterium]
MFSTEELVQELGLTAELELARRNHEAAAQAAREINQRYWEDRNALANNMRRLYSRGGGRR